MFVSFYLFYQYIFSRLFEVLINFFLVPQIIHQAIKGTQQQQNRYFVLGFMASRSLLPVSCFYIKLEKINVISSSNKKLYFRGCPENFYQLSPSFITSFSIVAIVGVQVKFEYQYRHERLEINVLLY
jgi:hypothetical protein